MRWELESHGPDPLAKSHPGRESRLRCAPNHGASHRRGSNSPPHKAASKRPLHRPHNDWYHFAAATEVHHRHHPVSPAASPRAQPHLDADQPAAASVEARLSSAAKRPAAASLSSAAAAAAPVAAPAAAPAAADGGFAPPLLQRGPSQVRFDTTAAERRTASRRRSEPNRKSVSEPSDNGGAALIDVDEPNEDELREQAQRSKSATRIQRIYRGHHTRDVVTHVRQENGGRMSNVDMSRAILAHLGNPEERRRRASLGLVEKLKAKRDAAKDAVVAAAGGANGGARAGSENSRLPSRGSACTGLFGSSVKSEESRRRAQKVDGGKSTTDYSQGQGALNLADAKAMAELEKQVARPTGSSKRIGIQGGSFRSRNSRRRGSDAGEEDESDEEMEANTELLHFANRFLWLSSVIDDVSTVVFPTAFAIFTAVIFGPTQFNMVWEPHPTLVYFNATERDWTLGSAEACGATEYDTVEWASGF